MKRHHRSSEMLLVLCLAVIIVETFADKFAKIIESKSSSDGLGNYEFKVLTSDGITRWQTGRLQYSGDKPYIHVEGGYSYLDRLQGVKRVVTFVADQNGFRPTLSQEDSLVIFTSSTPPPQSFPSRFGASAIGG